MLGQSNLSQRSGKAKTMQQTKAEGHEPRQPPRKTWFSLPCIQNLDGNQHDAERYGCFYGRARDIHKTERCGREGDAVCNRKCRHGDSDTPPVSHKNHQRQDKKQVVEAEQDMFDTKAEISRGDFSRARRGLNDERRPCRRQPLGLCGTGKTFDPNQYVGQCSRQALDDNRVSGEPSVAADGAAFDIGPVTERCPRRPDILGAFGQL